MQGRGGVEIWTLLFIFNPSSFRKEKEGIFCEYAALNGCIRTNGHILFCIRFSRFSAFPHHIKPDSIVPSIRKKVELFWTRKLKFNFASIFPSRKNGSISRLKGSTAANVFRAPEVNICGTQTGRKIAFTKNNFNAIFWRKRATEQVCPQLF